MLISAVGVAAVAVYVKLAPADRVPEELRRPKASTDRAQTGFGKERSGREFSFLTPYYEDGELRFRSELRPVVETEDARVAVVNSYLRTSGLLPPEARLLGISVDSGVAALSFTAEFAPALGSSDESTVVIGIRAALGQFPEIDSVLFYSDGEPIETLGHFELTEPAKVIRPDAWSHPTRPAAAPEPSRRG